MTTYERTRAREKNPGAPVDADAQLIVDLLDESGTATIEGLAYRLGLPTRRVRAIVESLQADGVVTVKTGFSHTQVTLVNRPRDVLTDGGSDEEFPPAMAELSDEEVFFVLSNARRRIGLEVLANLMSASSDASGESLGAGTYEPVYASVGEIAHRIESIRTGTPLGDLSTTQRRRGYISLIQQHLDVLDELEIVAYYERPKKVTPFPTVVTLAEIITDVRQRCGQSRSEIPAALRWDGSDEDGE